MLESDTRAHGQTRTNGDESRNLEQLREILLGREQREIQVLREHLEDPELHARDLSTVLARAIRIRREEREAQEDLDDSLIPSIEQGIRVSVRRDPAPIADALYPAM